MYRVRGEFVICNVKEFDEPEPRLCVRAYRPGLVPYPDSEWITTAGLCCGVFYYIQVTRGRTVRLSTLYRASC